MKYYFKLSEKEKRVRNLVNGRPNIAPIKLYPESDAIIEDFENNALSDWWGVWKYGTSLEDFTDYSSKEEALKDYLNNEAREAGEILYNL